MTLKREPQRPSATWVLVADRSRARLFTAQWPKLEELLELETLVHPEGTAHQRDVEADGHGRFQEPSGPSHSGEAKTDFKHRTAITFARKIVGELQRGIDNNAFGRLVIVAPALFLGVLREHLPDPMRQLVIAESDKDLTHFDASAVLAEVCRLTGSTAGSS